MANLYDQATQRQKWDQTIEQVQKMGYPQNPAQPPAFTSPQPRRPTSLGDAAAATSNPGVTQLPPSATQGSAPGPSQLYMQDRADELRTQVGAGNYAQAAGTAVRTAVQGLGMYGIELADKLATPAINAAASFGRGVMGADSQAAPTTTPATTLASAVPGAPPQAAPTAPSITPQTDVQRGGGNVPAVAPPSTNPAAPSPAATGAEIAPGVYRHGRGQYSDNASGMGMPSGFTGQPNAQNMAAADALAGRQIPAGTQTAGVQAPGGMATPVVPNSTNDWAARNNLRNLAVSASSITANGGRFDQSGRGDSPEVSAYKAALANDFALQQAQPGLAAVAMRENAGIQREGMQQEGATTRTGIQERGSMGRTMAQAALEQQKINQAAVTQGIDNRGKTLVQDLQSKIATEPDSAKRQEMAQRLREMQGQSTADPYLVVPGGQAVDEMGRPYTMPPMVFNRQTQQVVQLPKQGGATATVSTPQQLAALPSGSVYTGPDGKQYRKN